MKKYIQKIGGLFLFMCLICSMVSVGYAQQQSDQQGEDYLPVVSDVEVQGNVIVSNTTVLSKIKLRKGQSLSREVINQDIKRLYSTGFFKDVKVDIVSKGNDYSVVFIVDEKPVVKKITIKGNTVFKKHTILKEISLEEGQVLDNKLLKEAMHNIELKYKKKGYRFIFVEDAVTVDADKKEARITITINEGGKFKIAAIAFEGNESFPAKRLRKIMKTKKRGLIRRKGFDQFVFEDDVDRIKLFYQKNGFLDVTVDPVVDYNNADNTIYITMKIQESVQYFVNAVRFSGNAQVPQIELWDVLEMVAGSVYSPEQLYSDANNIKNHYFEKGRVEALVEPDVQFDKNNARVDITYQIIEGDIFYIDKVRVRGNTKTKDIVIRRELRVYPGERFNGTKLEESKKRLEALQFFESVKYDLEPGSASDKKDLVFNVKEQKTGEFSFGGGVSSLESFLGFVEVSQNNFDCTNWPTFTGDGQRLSLKGRWGAVSRDVNISFFEPYLFDKNYSFGFDIYNWEEDISTLDYATQRTGASMTFGKDHTDALRSVLRYKLERVKMKDISEDAHSDVKQTQKTSTLSKLKYSLFYDKRNNTIAPTNGYLAGVSTEFVGGLLGGEEDFYDAEVSYTRYWSLKEDHVLELQSRLGIVNDFGGSNFVPVYDRLYAGGLGSVRGFNYKRVGPMGNGNPIGGETLFLTSLEYTFPLIENFKGAFFMDVGQVNADACMLDAGDFAVSIGPGLSINTPIGPMVFYYGYPIANEDDKDKNGRFEFSFKRAF